MDIVIIGNGITGITAALRLRQKQPDWNIAVISGESTFHYSRPALMYSGAAQYGAWTHVRSGRGSVRFQPRASRNFSTKLLACLGRATKRWLSS